MSVIQKSFNQNIGVKMSQLQQDLEVILNEIFDKAGSKIQLEEKIEYIDTLAGTKKAIERFKYKYCYSVSPAENVKNPL